MGHPREGREGEAIIGFLLLPSLRGPRGGEVAAQLGRTALTAVVPARRSAANLKVSVFSAALLTPQLRGGVQTPGPGRARVVRASTRPAQCGHVAGRGRSKLRRSLLSGTSASCPGGRLRTGSTEPIAMSATSERA